MREILFASTNKGKLAEVQQVASEFGITIVSPDGLVDRVKGPPPEVDESSSTYAGNAKLKAEAFSLWSGLPSIADDTGLEVQALQGRPGVHSARYAGLAARPADNIAKLLKELSGVSTPNRGARFYCYLYFRMPTGKVLTSDGSLEGQITESPHGGGGFGYDSVFQVGGMSETLAQLKERNHRVVTHRIAACRKLFQEIAHCLRAS